MDFGAIDKKDLMIAGAIVGGFLLIALLKKGATSSTTTPSSTGASALVGGYTTAQTVYVPTSSYDINYNYGTQSTTTTTATATGTGSMISGGANPEPTTTTTTTSSPTGTTTNPAPAPAAPAPTSGTTPIGPPQKVAPGSPSKPVVVTPSTPATRPPAHTTSVHGNSGTTVATVRAGNTLWGLEAAALGGHASNAQIQAAVNKDVVVNHLSHGGNLIYAGQKLKLVK